MFLKRGSAFAGVAMTYSPITQAAAYADSLPSPWAVINGTEATTAAWLAVTTLSTGRYAVAGTVPNTFSTGAIVEVGVNVTVTSVTGGVPVARFQVIADNCYNSLILETGTLRADPTGYPVMLSEGHELDGVDLVDGGNVTRLSYRGIGGFGGDGSRPDYADASGATFLIWLVDTWYLYLNSDEYDSTTLIGTYNRLPPATGSVYIRSHLDARFSAINSFVQQAAENVYAYVETRTIPTSLHVLNTDLTVVRIAKLDNLDATVTSRLAFVSYTAPPSATNVASAVAATMLATPSNKILVNSAGYVSVANAVTLQPAEKTDIMAGVWTGASVADLDNIDQTIIGGWLVDVLTTIFSDYSRRTDTVVSTIDVDAIADVILVNPANKLLTDANGYVTASNASNPLGPGSISTLIRTKDTEGVPIDGVSVWITSDAGGTDTIAGALTSDASGEVTFLLDAGSWYVWRQLSGKNFTNPQVITVS